MTLLIIALWINAGGKLLALVFGDVISVSAKIAKDAGDDDVATTEFRPQTGMRKLKRAVGAAISMLAALALQGTFM